MDEEPLYIITHRNVVRFDVPISFRFGSWKKGRFSIPLPLIWAVF